MSIYSNCLRKLASYDDYDDDPLYWSGVDGDDEEDIRSADGSLVPMSGVKSSGGIHSVPLSPNQAMYKDPDTGAWVRYDKLSMEKEPDGKYYSRNRTTQKELDKANGLVRVLNFLRSPYGFTASGTFAGAISGSLLAGKGNRIAGGLIGAGVGGGAGYLAHYLAKKHNLV